MNIQAEGQLLLWPVLQSECGSSIKQLCLRMQVLVFSNSAGLLEIIKHLLTSHEHLSRGAAAVVACSAV